MAQPIDHDLINGYTRYGYLQGPEEPAVRRARLHIAAQRG
jgi:hypothetical protein